MTTTFRKGDRVYLLQNWDRNGTVSVTEAIVYACGKKQMILTHAATGEELGRNFLPGEKQYNHDRVMARTVRADAEAVALEIAAEILVDEREAHAKRLEMWGDNQVYRKTIEECIAALHEPRVIWR